MAIISPSSPPEPAFANPLDPLMGYQLRRASAAVLADLARALSDLDLRPTDASVVLLIATNPAITQSDIGRILGIHRANMAPLAAMLTDRGVIERARADGRSHALRLTAGGEALAEDIRTRIAVHEARFLPELSPQARTELVALIRQVWMR